MNVRTGAEMRVILYTGKGGVGKTSIAAATACQIAAAGKKVLIMSTDQAHSLGDSFDCKLGREPVEVTENLTACEIDSVYESEKSWGRLNGYMKEMLTLKGTDGIDVEELLVFPGMEELFSLFKILDYYEAGSFDVIIVDCAPTGETLSLLKYPEMLGGLIDKVLPMKRKMVRVAGPAIEKLLKIPMPRDDVFDDITYVFDKMERLQQLLLNKEAVSVRIVTTPEKIVIQEAKRNFACLHLFDYNVDALFINRIYPREAMEGYFEKWIQMQEDGLKEISESFSEIPQFTLYLQKEEIRTLPVLRDVGQKIYGDKDPLPVLFCKEIYRLTLEDQKAVLSVLLPAACKAELELNQNGEEIILGYRNEIRRFPMPDKVKGMDITGAKMEGEYLKIYLCTETPDKSM